MRILFVSFLIFMLGLVEQSFGAINKHEGILNIVQNEISVEDSIDVVWVKVNEIVNGQLFDIKMVDEKTHTIIFKFFSDKPCLFVDCGLEELVSKNKSPNNACDGSEFKYQITKPGQEQTIISNDIYTFVDGIVTLKLASREDGTSAIIDVDFTLHILVDRSEETVDSLGNKINEKNIAIADECNFSTLEVRKCNKLRGISCFSKGVFEKTILTMIEN